MMIRVDQQRRTFTFAGFSNVRDVRDDLGRLEQHRRQQHAANSIVHLAGNALGEGVDRMRRNLSHLDAHFSKSIELPPQRVKLTRRRDQRTAARSRYQHRRQQPHDQFVCVLTEDDVAVGIVQQSLPSGANAISDNAGAIPFVVHELGRIEPCPLLRFERDIGPCLMRMTGEQNPLTNPKPRVMPRQLNRRQMLNSSGLRTRTSDVGLGPAKAGASMPCRASDCGLRTSN